MKKKLMILITIGLVSIAFISGCQNNSNTEQTVYEETMDISKEYISLRYQTDNILINAKSYPSYKVWDKEISELIEKREDMEKNALELEKLATTMATSTISFTIFPKTYAYDKQEISDIFDKAPAGKKIATLAKHLGVDAKTAFKILKNDQAQVEADAWNEAGDTFQALETSATVIKDGCKVTGFIGGIIISGGIGATALAQSATIVAGADLVLEVSDDASKIALGNNNKVSKVISTVRVVTEPLGTILTIANIPENLANKFEKFNAVMLGLDQFNGAAQEGKIVGIQLPVYTPAQKPQAVKLTVLEKDEIQKRLNENDLKDPPTTQQDIENILDIDKPEREDEEKKDNTDIDKSGDEQIGAKNGKILGTWKGVLQWTPSQSEPQQEKERVLNFENDGKITTELPGIENVTWVQEGNSVKLLGEKNSYYEFILANNILTFVKLAGLDSEGQRSETLAGSDFFGGKFWTIVLKKQ